MPILEPTRPPAPELARTYRERGYWQDRPFADFLRTAATAHGDRLAVISERVSLSFSEVDKLAGRVAAALHARGVGRGDVVSFQLPNWWEAVVLFQGVARIGAVANPIVSIYREHELRHILGQAGTKLAVIPDHYRNTDYSAIYRELRPALPELTDVVVIGEAGRDEIGWETFLASGAEEPTVEVNPDHVALLLYTSGTTAAAKGVLHSGNTLVYEAQSIVDWFKLTEQDVIFTPSPLTHSTGIKCGLSMPFLLGCPVVLQETWDPQLAWRLITRHGATFMIFSTPFLNGLLEAENASENPPIRWVVCGGADVPPGLLERATERVGTAVRMYGASECPSATSTNTEDPPHAQTRTDGRWMAPTEGVLLDEHGAVLCPGQEGEVAWRGPDMFLGYLDASLNDAAFTADGWFRTGDLGVHDEDGYLTITGRLKDIVNRAGEKFSAKEIEDLLAAHPSIRDVAVVAVPDPVTVEKACAVIVPAPGTAPTLSELDEYLTGLQLSRRKIPEHLRLVDELPRTASGKVQKHLLREWAAG